MSKRRPSGDGMVRRRDDGRWEGRIVVGHKSDGNPIFRYVYGKTQKELLDKLHRSIEVYDGAELTEDSSLTLGAWLDRWMDEYAPATSRPSTLQGYRSYAANYIKPFLGKKKISALTTEDVQKLYRKLKTEGRVKEHPEHGTRPVRRQCPPRPLHAAVGAGGGEAPAHDRREPGRGRGGAEVRGPAAENSQRRGAGPLHGNDPS